MSNQSIPAASFLVFNKLMWEWKDADSLFTASFSGIRVAERGPGFSLGTCGELTLYACLTTVTPPPQIYSSCPTRGIQVLLPAVIFSQCSCSIRPFPQQAAHTLIWSPERLNTLIHSSAVFLHVHFIVSPLHLWLHSSHSTYCPQPGHLTCSPS